jgi:hypothetical protein
MTEMLCEPVTHDPLFPTMHPQYFAPVKRVVPPGFNRVTKNQVHLTHFWFLAVFLAYVKTTFLLYRISR